MMDTEALVRWVAAAGRPRAPAAPREMYRDRKTHTDTPIRFRARPGCGPTRRRPKVRYWGPSLLHRLQGPDDGAGEGVAD